MKLTNLSTVDKLVRLTLRSTGASDSVEVRAGYLLNFRLKGGQPEDYVNLLLDPFKETTLTETKEALKNAVSRLTSQTRAKCAATAEEPEHTNSMKEAVKKEVLPPYQVLPPEGAPYGSDHYPGVPGRGHLHPLGWDDMSD